MFCFQASPSRTLRENTLSIGMLHDSCKRTSGDAARKMNADLLIEIIHEMKKNVRTTKGKPRAIEAGRIAELAHLLEQKINVEKTLERMSESLDALLETTHTLKEKECVAKATVLNLTQPLQVKSKKHCTLSNVR